MNQTDKSQIMFDRLDFLAKTFNTKVNLNPFQQMLRESESITNLDVIIGYLSTLLYSIGFDKQGANLIVEKSSATGLQDLLAMLRKLAKGNEQSDIQN